MDHHRTIRRDLRLSPALTGGPRAGIVRLVIAGAALAAVACGGEGKGAGGTRSDSGGAPAGAAEGRTDSMPGMGGTTNMPGMGHMMSGRMLADMETHMRAMHGAGADSLRRALPAHRQSVANMIAQMNREMGDMNMTADAVWTALLDSVRADLTRMPEMSIEELARSMPNHHGHVKRLMRAHGEMMRSMSR